MSNPMQVTLSRELSRRRAELILEVAKIALPALIARSGKAESMDTWCDDVSDVAIMLGHCVARDYFEATIDG